MLNENQVLLLLNGVIPNLKLYDQQQLAAQKQGYKQQIIPFTGVYEMAVQQKKKIEIHAEDGVFPEDLFSCRAPNQTQEEFDYLKANFQSITLPVWESFQSLLNRIWVDQNWKIDFKDDKDVQAYLESNYPLYGAVETFFKDVVTVQKELDNNGIVVVKPYAIPTVEQNGEIVINDRDYVDPYAVYYGSEQVIGFKPSLYAMILTSEKTSIEYQGKNQQIGYVIELYDDTYIYRFEQTGKKQDWKFNVTQWFQHGLGYMPAWKLNGKAKQVDDEVFYKSVFISAVPNLDRALLDDSYLSAKKAQVAYPHKWQYVSECNFTDTNGGRCINGNIDFEGSTRTCPSCKGSGKKGSVMGVTEVDMPTIFDGSTNSIAPPFLGFVEPGTDNLRLLREEIDSYIAKGASMLKLDITKASVSGSSKTATGDVIDREETFTLIKNISNQIFAIFINSVNAIVEIRFGKDRDKPVITPPVVFELRSDFDITEEVTLLKTAGMPDVVIVQAIKEFMNIRFSLDVNAQSILNLSAYADRLLTLSPADIVTKKASGTIAAWEDVLHTSFYSIVAEAINNDPLFFEKPQEEQKSVVVAAAKLIQSSITQQIVDTGGIIQKANNVAA